MMADVTGQVASDFQPKEAAALAAKHKDVVVGVKSAHYQLPDSPGSMLRMRACP
jgi:hypothetical protein